MKEIGGMILKITSVCVAIVGIIITVIASFFLYNAMMVTEYSWDSKLQTLLWFFVLAAGVAFGLFGFYGSMNALDYDNDANKKCIIYGLVMLVLSIANGIVIAINFNILALLSLIIVGVPLLLSVLYIVSALLKLIGMKKSE